MYHISLCFNNKIIKKIFCIALFFIRNELTWIYIFTQHMMMMMMYTCKVQSLGPCGLGTSNALKPAANVHKSIHYCTNLIYCTEVHLYFCQCQCMLALFKFYNPQTYDMNLYHAYVIFVCIHIHRGVWHTNSETHNIFDSEKLKFFL